MYAWMCICLYMCVHEYVSTRVGVCVCLCVRARVGVWVGMRPRKLEFVPISFLLNLGLEHAGYHVAPPQLSRLWTWPNC